ncbi:MAG: hypothetical protein MZU79_04890 [Anaerotruncus sp.]|nr:hypothetical protein [Anaerotruncus sp.]
MPYRIVCGRPQPFGPEGGPARLRRAGVPGDRLRGRGLPARVGPGLRPDALLVSLTLPGRDGYEVGRALRSRKELASVPLVGLRGSFECVDTDRTVPADYDEVLPKPFDSERLAAVVRELIARKTGPSLAARGAPLARGRGGGPGRPAPGRRRAARPVRRRRSRRSSARRSARWSARSRNGSGPASWPTSRNRNPRS